ncbi:hypothetical protein [Streptosporangium canum]|uniref:hypothetical protein n=1 Tax=Streptosporangium canum TaxID=324952 RepID=UPI00379139CA
MPVDPERPQPVEILDHLRWQRQAVPGGEPGQLLAVPLPLPDLRPQPLVDVRDRRGELLLADPQQLPYPRRRDPGLGEGPDVGEDQPVIGVEPGRGDVRLLADKPLDTGTPVPIEPRRMPFAAGAGASGSRRPSSAPVVLKPRLRTR